MIGQVSVDQDLTVRPDEARDRRSRPARPLTSLLPEARGILQPTPKEVELLTQPIRQNERLSGGSNEVRMIVFENGSKAIFKPGDGERPLEHAPHQLYKRERAAYLVDRAHNFGLVPATVIRKIGGREGSVQEFVDFDSIGLWHISNRDRFASQLYKLAILDYDIWNKDREEKNVGIKGEQLGAFDNGLSWDEWWEYQISDNLMTYVVDRTAPAGLIESLKRSGQPNLQADLRNQLSELLPQRAIEAYFARNSHVINCLSGGRRITANDLLRRDGAIYFPNG